MNSSLFHRPAPVVAFTLLQVLMVAALVTLSGCRAGDGTVPKVSKSELASIKVDELYKLGFGLVRIDRLDVEGVAVTEAARGRNAADNVGQQASDLGFSFGTLYVNKLRELRKLPRSSVEVAVNTRYGSNPAAPENRLVYPVLKRHISSVFAGLNLAPLDVVQDYASVRYMQ